MHTHEDELQKNLKQLQLSITIDDVNKKSMRDEIRKHAAKKQRRAKVKRSVTWFSTAAALMIFSVILLNVFADKQSTLPVKDHHQTEHNGSPDKKDPTHKGENHNDHPADDDDESQQLTLEEGDTETQTIIREGMEDETEVTNFVLNPYGIQFQMDEVIDHYDVRENEVEFTNSNDMVTIVMSVREDAEVEDVANEVESEYGDDFDFVDGPSETSEDDNPYPGIKQHFSDPPQGYYVYQIGDDVFMITYEYDIEAADGMGPILQALQESIKE